MKKNLFAFVLSVMLASLCIGCGAEDTTTVTSSENSAVSANEASEAGETEEPATTEESDVTGETETTEESGETEETMATEAPAEEAHTHNYIETITTEAACETEGLMTFRCECGDSYTEAIPATGHSYENYVYNEDATYTADGTETATCANCDSTDTRSAEGTILENNEIDTPSSNDEVSETGQTDTASLPSFPYPLHTWTLQTSAEGCPIYVIYTTYTNIGDIRWGTPSPTPDIFGPDGAGMLWDTVSEFAHAHGCGFHFLYPVTKVGDYAEGTIYQCIAGAHYSTGGACPVFDPAICQVGTVD